MKKLLFTIVVAFVFTGIAGAQTYQEVVYLKNGSEIRGVVIEQIPNQSLKIQTSDGSIFAYPMSDVEKITKEAPFNSTNKTLNKTVKDSTSGLHKGYRGFVDIADTFGVGSFATERSEVSTVHGYQFNKNLFLGIGVGVDYFYEYEVIELPVFADIRVDFLNRRTTPFLDIRAGYTFFDEKGAYLAPSLGARFNLGSWGALNVGVGYTIQFIQYRNYNIFDEPIYPRTGTEKLEGITIRVGFDF